jgi:Fe-S-cluster containining protein
MVDHCKDCGLCCKKMIAEIQHIDVVREPKLLQIARLLDGNGKIQYDSDWEKEYSLYCGDGCKLLTDDNRCSIYPTRPNCCVALEVGGDKCNELREIYGLPEITAEGA